MRFEWEVLENLDEIVYVTDVKTNELVYMNAKLRQVLGVTEEDYKGKPCYKLLQGLDNQCPFCVNSDLKKGQFHTWVYKNPTSDEKFLLKGTLIEQDGKQYRLEIAVEADSKVLNKVDQYYVRTETILNDCLRGVFSTEDPSESLENMVQYIGKTFRCERVYIFEFAGENAANNTYEWCMEGSSVPRKTFEGEPAEVIEWWTNTLEKQGIVAIDDLESILTKYPLLYANLKSQNITSLVAAPIYENDTIIGFVGVDNPDRGMLHLILPFMKVINYFVSNLIKRRDLMEHLHTLSYHDQLTGALNRNALVELYKEAPVCDSMGVIYCDISGLKIVNDTQGHAAGDAVIVECCKLLQKVTSTGDVYRIGGDEFIAVCKNITEQDLKRIFEDLRKKSSLSECHIALGYAWSNENPISLEQLVSVADKVMYQNKREYYCNCSAEQRKRRDRRMLDASAHTTGTVSPFNRFLSENYYDAEMIFASLTSNDASQYIYFGDLQTNCFYISDNMRETFGFSENIVPDLLKEWERCIATPEHLKLYQDDVKSILAEKRKIHDIRYQVRDVSGSIMWIRCYGKLLWDEEKGIPLFFSGSVTRQDNTLIIDPITNFPRESMALRKLEKLTQPTTVIAFSLNHFTEINETKGRYVANTLIRNVAESISSCLGGSLSFYRLDGLRFIAIPLEGVQADIAGMVATLRKVIDEEYHRANITVHRSSSFGIIEFDGASETPQSLLENAIVLISSAKASSDSEYVEFSPENIGNMKQTASMALVLSQNVLNSMENFRIVIQPVVSSATGVPAGGEVLMRWRYKGKDVSPAVFIPLMEKSKTIHLAGKWVFEQAVRACRQLIKINPDFYLTFNVSYHQIMNDDFIQFVDKTIRDYNMSGKNLVAELTETHFDENPEKLSHFVECCTNLGIRVALDDFGNGYSSLGLLLKYPTSIIKLDRSLLMEMTTSVDKLNFISSIVYACHRFGKKVCMEGVETQEQDALIKQAKCDMIQGYYYYRPLELEDVYALLISSNESDSSAAKPQEDKH